MDSATSPDVVVNGSPTVLSSPGSKMNDLRKATTEVETEIANMPYSAKQAYMQAKQKFSELIEAESPIAVFLREGLDTTETAKRLVQHWQSRKEVFGEETFLLPVLNLTGEGALSKEDLRILKTGFFTLLPKDKEGHQVFCLDARRLQRAMHNDEKGLLRAVFYLLVTVATSEAGDDEKPLSGCSMLVQFGLDASALDDAAFARKVFELASESMPLRFKDVHFVFSPPECNEKVIPATLEKFGECKSLLSGVHVCYTDQVAKNLLPHGFSLETLPRSMGGECDDYSSLMALLQKEGLREEPDPVESSIKAVDKEEPPAPVVPSSVNHHHHHHDSSSSSDEGEAAEVLASLAGLSSPPTKKKRAYKKKDPKAPTAKKPRKKSDKPKKSPRASAKKPSPVFAPSSPSAAAVGPPDKMKELKDIVLGKMNKKSPPKKRFSSMMSGSSNQPDATEAEAAPESNKRTRTSEGEERSVRQALLEGIQEGNISNNDVVALDLLLRQNPGLASQLSQGGLPSSMLESARETDVETLLARMMPQASNSYEDQLARLIYEREAAAEAEQQQRRQELLMQLIQSSGGEGGGPSSLLQQRSQEQEQLEALMAQFRGQVSNQPNQYGLQLAAQMEAEQREREQLQALLQQSFPGADAGQMNPNRNNAILEQLLAQQQQQQQLQQQYHQQLLQIQRAQLLRAELERAEPQSDLTTLLQQIRGAPEAASPQQAAAPDIYAQLRQLQAEREIEALLQRQLSEGQQYNLGPDNNIQQQANNADPAELERLLLLRRFL